MILVVIASTKRTNASDDNDSGLPFVIEMAGIH